MSISQRDTLSQTLHITKRSEADQNRKDREQWRPFCESELTERMLDVMIIANTQSDWLTERGTLRVCNKQIHSIKSIITSLNESDDG